MYKYNHIEVQGQVEPDFPEPMYVYNYRLFDRYHRPVASFAILAMAHLRTQATHRDAEARFHWKLRLTRSLYEHEYDREDVQHLLRLWTG
jgi:hypothetical protein